MLFYYCLKTCMIIHELSEMMILEELGMIIGLVVGAAIVVAGVVLVIKSKKS